MLKRLRGPGWAHTTLPILAGLLLTQMLATFFVWQSNLRLFSQAQALTAAGWLPLPAGSAAALLKTPGAALGGGLFFTLSSGAGLVLAAWAAVQLRRRVLRDARGTLPLLGLLWAALLVAANARGWVWFPTLLILLPPGVTAGLTLWALKRRGVQTGWLGVVPVAVLIALTALWSTRLDQRLFTAIRDHVLLSNPIGQGVNDFYYRYTLQAAELFKSLEQKTIRTCRISDDLDPAAAVRLRDRLSAGDVLAMPPGVPADLRIRGDGSGKFEAAFRDGRLTLDSERETAPALWLPRLSAMTDHFAFFRRITFFGLLIGFPVLLYMGVYGCLRWTAGIVLRPSAATLTAALLCLAAGVLLYLPMLGGRTVPFSAHDLNGALADAGRNRRVAALRWIEDHRMEIADYPAYRPLLGSPHVVERYWLARAMAPSRSHQIRSELLALIDDPQPIVVCQAFYALGRQGDPRAVEPIRERILKSDHWYTQWYGYRALRGLGWRQTPSG